MIDIPSKVLSRLSKWFLFANTPRYLYKKFRSDISVREIANEYTPDELAHFVQEIDQSENRNIQDVVKAYIFVVALTFQNPSGVFENLESIRIENLKWVGDLIRIWDSQRSGTSQIEINMAHSPEVNSSVSATNP